MKIKSPLRYPGGKTRAVNKILPYIPEGINLCSPFFGGGSIEIAYALANPNNKVYGYDLFEPIVCFWKYILEDSVSLSEEISKVRNSFNKAQFNQFRKELKENFIISEKTAAKVYAINRSSFSGATFSGGFSKQSIEGRFTQSSVDRVKNFKVPNLSVSVSDFKDTIKKHQEEFLYLDPPYLLQKGSNKLYGDKGSTHEGFDHEGLANLIKTRKGWVMSYNDSEWIRDTYRDFEIVKLDWSYGMNKTKKSSEVLIISK